MTTTEEVAKMHITFTNGEEQYINSWCHDWKQLIWLAMWASKEKSHPGSHLAKHDEVAKMLATCIWTNGDKCHTHFSAMTDNSSFDWLPVLQTLFIDQSFGRDANIFYSWIQCSSFTSVILNISCLRLFCLVKLENKWIYIYGCVFKKKM